MMSVPPRGPPGCTLRGVTKAGPTYTLDQVLYEQEISTGIYNHVVQALSENRRSTASNFASVSSRSWRSTSSNYLGP